jgi:hypothetical protein
MKIEIPTNDSDDATFVDLIGRIASELVDSSSPEQLFLIKIDNWFDHKWLKFSGKGRVGFGFFEDYLVGMDMDTALDEFRQDQVTFPPFSPRRVIEQYYFLRGDNGNYTFPKRAPLVHQRILRHSSDNLHKRVVDFAGSAIFVWLSSNTEANGRGSFMVYQVQDGEVQTWYVNLTKARGEWRLLKTKGIAPSEVQSLIVAQHLQPRT